MNRTGLTLVAAASLSAATAAMSQVYVGIGAGATDIDINCANTSTCDTGSTGTKAYGGLRITPNVGFEITYFDWGKATATGPGALSGRLNGSGWGIGGAYFHAFDSRWQGVARAGIASNKSDITGAWGAFMSADSKTRYSLYGGLGAAYMLLPKLSIDAGIDISRVKYSGEVAYARLLSVGASFHF